MGATGSAAGGQRGAFSHSGRSTTPHKKAFHSAQPLSLECFQIPPINRCSRSVFEPKWIHRKNNVSLPANSMQNHREKSNKKNGHARGKIGSNFRGGGGFWHLQAIPIHPKCQKILFPDFNSRARTDRGSALHCFILKAVRDTKKTPLENRHAGYMGLG